MGYFYVVEHMGPINEAKDFFSGTIHGAIHGTEFNLRTQLG